MNFAAVSKQRLTPEAMVTKVQQTLLMVKHTMVGPGPVRSVTHLICNNILDRHDEYSSKSV